MDKTMLYKLPRLLKVIVLYSFLFLTFGSMLEVLYSPRQNASSATAPVASVALSQHAVDMPKQLVIPRLGINLSVVPGQYDSTTKTWTLTESDVQYAAMTALPNEHSGNTLLYGHNTPEVLAPTDRLAEGDTAQIVTQDDRTFTYVFTSGRLVAPNDMTVLEQTGLSPRLILLTCDGIWDEKRRVMEFDFVGVQ